MKDILIVVDMQNDFIDGVFSNEETKMIVPHIAKLVSTFEGDIIFTRDTHVSGYEHTIEGQKLPMHCKYNSDGWKINDQIYGAAFQNTNAKSHTVNKTSFCYRNWDESFDALGIEKWEQNKDGSIRYKNIYIVGTCTDICVIANAVVLRSIFNCNPITVYGNFCTGTSCEKHFEALDIMESCMIDIEYRCPECGEEIQVDRKHRSMMCDKCGYTAWW